MVTGRWKWNPPHPYFWFFSKNVFFTILGWTGQKMRYWIWGPVGFKPVYLLTYLSYLNSDKCILIPIEFPLIWYIMGLSRSKFDRFSRVWRSGKLPVIILPKVRYVNIGKEFMLLYPRGILSDISKTTCQKRMKIGQII